jgi:hypothetical protein
MIVVLQVVRLIGRNKKGLTIAHGERVPQDAFSFRIRLRRANWFQAFYYDSVALVRDAYVRC